MAPRQTAASAAAQVIDGQLGVFRTLILWVAVLLSAAWAVYFSSEFIKNGWRYVIEHLTRKWLEDVGAFVFAAAFQVFVYYVGMTGASGSISIGAFNFEVEIPEQPLLISSNIVMLSTAGVAYAIRDQSNWWYVSSARDAAATFVGGLFSLTIMRRWL